MVDENEKKTDEPDCGEVGGLLLSSPDKIVSDCNLISRYPIHPKLRTRLVRILAHIAESGHRARERIAACKALVAMDKLNIIQEQGGKSSGVTVNIVNQVSATATPMQLTELSDDDLMRIAGSGGGGAACPENGEDKPA